MDVKENHEGRPDAYMGQGITMQAEQTFSEISETDLLADLRKGNAQAFEALMRRYNRLLFRTARGIVHDDAEAQDAVQESFLRAFMNLHTFRGESALSTWLTRIVINQALTQQRKLGRLVLWEDAGLDKDNLIPEDAPAFMGMALETPEADAERRQVRERLERAIVQLPPIYRSVFILRAVEGLSVEDTAQALDITQTAVKTRFLRARSMLRLKLADNVESSAPALFAFAGKRCDDIVAHVLAQLRSTGVIRDQ